MRRKRPGEREPLRWRNKDVGLFVEREEREGNGPGPVCSANKVLCMLALTDQLVIWALCGP